MRATFAILFLLLAIPGARADPATRAHALNAQGKKHLQAKDYAAALEAFEDAYDIYPSAGLVANIGTTYQQMGKTVDAANWYQRYLDDPGAQEPFATQIANSLAVLDLNLGRLSITVDDPAAEIQIGDAAWLPASRAGLVRVSPGTFVVRARVADRATEQSGRVDAGAEARIELALTVADVAAPAESPAEIDETPAAIGTRKPGTRTAHASRPPLLAYLTGGAGVVALGASLGLAFAASDRYRQSEDACPDGCVGDALEESTRLASAGRTDRMWAIGLAVVGTAAVATGAVLWLRRPRGDSSAAITFVVEPGELALAATGTF